MAVKKTFGESSVEDTIGIGVILAITMEVQYYPPVPEVTLTVYPCEYLTDKDYSIECGLILLVSPAKYDELKNIQDKEALLDAVDDMKIITGVLTKFEPEGMTIACKDDLSAAVTIKAIADEV